MYEAIVIGGGIVGCSVAYNLVRQGAKTLLLDRRDKGRATDAGAGILSPELSGHRSEIWFDFAVEAVGYYRALSEQLQAEQDGETSYVQCGKLDVAVAEEELEEFVRTEALVFARQKRRGTPSPEVLRLISAEKAQGLLPALAPVQRAMYYSDAARVDGRILTQAITQAGVNQGLEVQQADVEKLALDGYLTDGVIVDGTLIKSGAVVIAGGAWSNRFAEQLLIPIPVQPQRGQIIHLHVPGVDTSQWPMVSSRQGYYLVCWPNGHLVMGATREILPEFRPTTTVEGVHRVLEEILWVAPGLARAEVKEVRVGLRPMTPDWLPVLGGIPGVDNLFVATGHGATGLQLGPYSGKLIADLVLGQTLETDISAFDVRRFL